MARIKNSARDNVYGSGKEQILTTDDGKQYRIKNTAKDNVYGGGKEKKIVEEGGGQSGTEFFVGLLPTWGVILLLIIIIGGALLIQKAL